MVDIKKELLAPCGLYCGVCAVYIVHSSNDNELKERLLPIFKKWGAKSIEDITCTGCLSDDIVFPFCQTCSIKSCIKEKNLEGCHQCNDFPCDIINNWPSPEGKQIILKEIQSWREMGTEKWVESVENRYKCPECGNSIYRGATQCFRCNALIDSL